MARNERELELITAARRLFYTKGYERTSINDIINAVGVSKGAFYHYFDSKQGVLEAVVETLIDQTKALIQPIMSDPTLNAIEKFNRMVRVINDWKIEQRDEILTVLRILYTEENLRLLHHMRQRSARVIVPIFAQIITQGVEEGIFETAFVQESAELVVGISRTSGLMIIDMLLNPEGYKDRVTIAMRMSAAGQVAIERMLNAPSGSLLLIDPDDIAVWFT